MSDYMLSTNYASFEHCLAGRILAQPGIVDTSNGVDVDTPSGSPLGDFTSYLASEVWPTLPVSLTSATSETRASLPDIDALPLEHIPPSFTDTLVSCGIADDTDGALAFLRRVLVDYIAEACAPPPVWSRTRASECEICERSVPLTNHHLIPRQVHAKALRRKWHPQAMLNSVAWLCKPCHSTVHQVAGNEELAREFYTVERLLEREDVQRWRKYISKQRYGARRG